MDQDQLPAEEQGTDEVITEARLKKAAAMAVGGAEKGDVRKALGLTYYAVNKLYNDEQFKKLVAELGDDAIVVAKQTTRNKIAKLAAKAVVALEKNLDKHNLEAVKVVLRSMGIEQQKEGDDKASGLTVVLATQPKPEPKTIEVVDRREDE